MQLEEEIHTNSRSQSGDRITIRYCDNCSESGHNTRTYKKNEETSNIYSSD